LIVRMGALGDIVHALPVLAALRAARPDVAVDWLVDARYAGVLALVDGLRRRIVVRAAAASRAADEVRFAGVPGMVLAVGDLRAQGYDAALDLQGLIKSAAFARLSGARRVIGFVRAQLREPAAGWLYRERVAGPAHGHVVAKNLAVLPALGVPSSGVVFPWKDLPSGAPAAVFADARVARAGGFAIVNPGAAWDNKRWPPERFGALAALLGERLGLPSVVTWGPGEEARAEAVVTASRGHALASPPTTLPDLLALARRARLVVSGDTGPLHLAASVGAPIVGLFGPTRPERNGPWLAADVSVSRATTCVCFHKRQCQRGRACIEDIDVNEVFAACARRLESVVAS
ncbi:MAG: glycosyltransferase family 9 protein, partial [Acidobacteria bacterium]|nr:glycosyltransferase family 9 protein [Acidobacteriota bacterium]